MNSRIRAIRICPARLVNVPQRGTGSPALATCVITRARMVTVPQEGTKRSFSTGHVRYNTEQVNWAPSINGTQDRGSTTT